MASSDTNDDMSTSTIDEKLSDDERLNKLFGKNLFEEKTPEQNTNKDYSLSEQVVKKSNSLKKEYDPYRVRTFFIMLAKAAMRHQIRMKAHHEYHDQVDKLKTAVQTAVKQPPKKRKETIDTEIEDLKKKISYMVQIERGMAASTTNPEHQKFQSRLQELESKIEWLIQHKQAREERFDKLEQKISSQNNTSTTAKNDSILNNQPIKKFSQEHDTAIDDLIQRLLVLQKNHLKIKIQSKSLKVNSPERKKMDIELADIKRKVELTKQAITSLREE